MVANVKRVDVLIIGAGAAGLMCAIEAGKRGRSVVVLDHAATLAEKIRISGGGRCNFTNLSIKPENYLSHNPHFCRSALARFTPQHFIAMLDKHHLRYSEKTSGQLFCDDGATAIIKMLVEECDAAGVQRILSCAVKHIQQAENFYVSAACGEFSCESLVIATGGLSIPKIGASAFGYKVAEQFGLPMVKPRPGLVPLSFHPEIWEPYATLAGIAVEVAIRCGKQSFRENLLFTHRGLSGPAILQISSYWSQGEALHIDLLPDQEMQQVLMDHKSSRMRLDNFLGQYLPQRFVEVWCLQFFESRPLNQYSEKQLVSIAERLHDWQVTPTGTLGYNKAEVTCGGVDTRALSSKTMQANEVPGLFFVGEVVDVTGQLGGYNFQWAWASGHAAGQVV